MKGGLHVAACLLMVVAATGCGRRSASVSSGAASASGVQSAAPMVQSPTQVSQAEQDRTGVEGLNVLPYPPARWRLVSFDELDRVTLWIGHIAIRHELSSTESLRAPGWEPDGPNPGRSPGLALALAQETHARLIHAPHEFETLARQHSEDLVTKELGGYLGGIRASQLASEFLDVLATLRPGEVSKPFQTPYGIHILKRYPPPAAEQVAGERIVIGYAGVYGLGRKVTRSREQAMALAQEVASRARRNPASFRALVTQYSDNEDRAIQGDLGVYSTQDPGYLPLEVDGLSRVKIGEIYGPIDGRLGFEILRRVPVGPRDEYAMAAIEVALDTRLPDEVTAVKQAGTEIAKLQQILASDPEKFEDLRRIRRSEKVRRWTYPKGDLALTRALGQLSLGQIAPEPVRYGMALLIVKRLDPKKLPPEPARLTELPNPSDPDYDALIGFNNGPQLAAAARAFVAELRGMRAGLQPKALDIIATTLDKLSADLDGSQADSASARTTIHAAFASLQRRLEADAYSKLLAAGREWVVQQMMPSAEVAGARATND
jgi:hypothetical protein